MSLFEQSFAEKETAEQIEAMRERRAARRKAAATEEIDPLSDGMAIGYNAGNRVIEESKPEYPPPVLTATPAPGTERPSGLDHVQLADCEHCTEMIWCLAFDDWVHIDSDEEECADE